MSQIKITLRPPPNVDFVHGYPGIPPAGPDRQHATVKGALEVRVNPQGVKAKWVQIILRKVESLPIAGQGYTFHDIIYPSPLYLWKASEEYQLLHTQDLPFVIRIPEAIPPTITLERAGRVGGIKYELLAQACIKGKRGLLRQRKDLTVSTVAEVTIDKHELHSTWPVYCQPESRVHAQEGVTLVVVRSQSCYGPGDRVSVMATIKSDTLNTVILRGFEFVLKETTIFRVAPASGKKDPPISKSIVIGEQRVPVNITLYGGTQHKAELACIIPPTHSTPSLGSARHIDITYMINVKALMGTGTHLIMDIPVTVSNWPRAISAEAIRRIGPVTSLSLSPHMNPSTVGQAMPHNEVSGSESYGNGPRTPGSSNLEDYSFSRGNPARSASTRTNLQSGSDANELGRRLSAVAEHARFVSPPIRSPPATLLTSPDLLEGSSVTRTGSSTGSSNRRSRSVGNASGSFTVANTGDEPEILRTGSYARRPTGTVTESPGTQIRTARGAWPAAEEEKQRLYIVAKAQADRIQGNIPRETRGGFQQSSRSTSPPQTTTPNQPRPPWPTAEEEKLRLFAQAKAAASISQGSAQQSLSSTSKEVQGSEFWASAGSSSHVTPSRSDTINKAYGGTVMYPQATSSVNKASIDQFAQAPAPSKSPIPQYPNADEEKAALRRYEEAKQAVNRVHGTNFTQGGSGYSQSSSTPTTKKSSGTNPSTSVTPPSSDSPPPFSATATSSVQPSWMIEKEKLRRAYEAQDAAAVGRPQVQNMSLPPSFTAASSSASAPPNWMNEKEKLRRMYEAQDAAAFQSQSPSSPPPAFEAASASSSTKPSWMNEKEKLRRAYEAQDAAAMAQHKSADPPPPFAALPTGGSSSRPPFSGEKEISRKGGSGSLQGSSSPPIASGLATSQAKRLIPSPPVRDGAPRPLTAAEEKALLNAKYATEDSTTAQNGHLSPSPSSMQDKPPPLMPRPPIAYIKETQEEDARISKLVSLVPPGFAHTRSDSLSNTPQNATPPPLPPKVPII